MSKVFFIKFDQKEKVADLAVAAGLNEVVKKKDFVAMKIHFGEEGNKGYIKPVWIRPLLDIVAARGAYPFLTDANTIYVGKRADAVNHLNMARTHGFSLEALDVPVIIADGLRGNSYKEVPVDGVHFSRVKIAQDIYYSDSIIFLTHFKGHEMTGFGGAIKNCGMGCASRSGKYAIHANIRPRADAKKCTGCGTCIRWCPANVLFLEDDRIRYDREGCLGCGECILSCPNKVFNIPWDESMQRAQEKLIEYASGVLKDKRERVLFINYINHVTAECDCYQTKSEPLIEDVGIVASRDPVAVDQASVDIVNKKAGRDLFKEIYPGIDWSFQLERARSSYLGKREYELIEL